MCIAGPLKSNRTKWHPHNLKFCTNFRNLLLYSISFNNFCKLSFSDASFNNFCHSLMQINIENILKQKGCCIMLCCYKDKIQWYSPINCYTNAIPNFSFIFSLLPHIIPENDMFMFKVQSKHIQSECNTCYLFH